MSSTYVAPTRRVYSGVLVGASGVLGLDTVINLFQGDFIVTAIHGVLTVLVYNGAKALRG